MQKPIIGFIGLGMMGSAMVDRLQSLDYSLLVLANNSRKNVDKAVARGAIEVSSGSKLANSCDLSLIHI